MSGPEWGEFPGHEDDPDEEWVGVTPQTYSELVETMIAERASTEYDVLQLPASVMILWAAAQPTAFENVIDVRDDLMAALFDWSEEDKERIRACEIVQVMFGCELRLTDHEHVDHFHMLAQILRLGASTAGTDWHWENVRSSLNFEDVVTDICDRYASPNTKKMTIAGRLRPGQLYGTFRTVSSGNRIEKEISEFRNELDALFPTAPEKGGNEDANPGPE